jgi:hypothetical protein
MTQYRVLCPTAALQHVPSSAEHGAIGIMSLKLPTQQPEAVPLQER